MKRIFDYWKEFSLDINIWRKYRKIARASSEDLNKNDMRVDYLGRIYTVINMPEEVINNQELIQQGWVIQQLGPMNTVLQQIGLNDYAYPDIIKIPSSDSYLVVMYPEIDTLNIWRILLNLIALGFIGTVIYFIINILNRFDVIDKIANIIEAINV
jgi:hypothetical protein